MNSSIIPDNILLYKKQAPSFQKGLAKNYRITWLLLNNQFFIYDFSLHTYTYIIDSIWQPLNTIN